jgi:hypothetical protein
VFSTIYASKLGRALVGSALPQHAVDAAKESVGGAEGLAHRAGVSSGPRAEDTLHAAINDSFVSGWHAGLWVCCGVVVLGALFAWRWLPARTAEGRLDVAVVEQTDVLAA